MEKKLTSPILLIEGGAQDANLRYLTGFTAPDPVVALVHGQQVSLVVPLLEYGRAINAARMARVFTPQMLGLKGTEAYSLAAWARTLLKQEGIRHVRVAHHFPVAVADALRQARVVLEVATTPLCPQRRRKTEAEVRAIARTQRAAVNAMKVAMHGIQQSTVDSRGFLQYEGRRLTAEQVRYWIEQSLLEKDCVATETIVAGGRQGADPHERGHGPLRAGYPIVVDIFPRHKETGYWGDITRTLIKGPPKPIVARMWQAVADAQRAALQTCKAGVTVKRVHTVAQHALRAHGFETTVKNGWGEGFIHSTGHGVGLDIHEAPSLNLSTTRLRSGDVVTVEPGLYYKAYGGVRIEDTVVITPAGFRWLARCPLQI